MACYNGRVEKEGRMDNYVFDDVLAGSTVSCSYPGLEAVRTAPADDKPASKSLFFPGCSFLNYAMPLVQSVYDLLRNAGEVDGISVLCCGKILQYEGDGGASRAAFEQQFREHIAQTDVQRIVAACPNCVYALRKLLARDEATAGIEIVPSKPAIPQLRSAAMSALRVFSAGAASSPNRAASTCLMSALLSRWSASLARFSTSATHSSRSRALLQVKPSGRSCAHSSASVSLRLMIVPFRG